MPKEPINPEFELPTEKQLDRGVEESFPASDPVSVEVSKYAPGDGPGNNSKTGADKAADPSPLSHMASVAGEAFAEARPVVGEGLVRAEKTLRANPLVVAAIAGLVGLGIAAIVYERMSQPKKLKRRAYGASEIF